MASAVDGVRAALASVPRGVAWVQLRDKSAGPEQIQAAASQLLPILRKANALLVVNGSVELALSCRADGVHLPEVAGCPSALIAARRAHAPTGDRLIVGTSRHSSESAREARIDADYVFLGPIWPTPTKPDALGPEALEAARAQGVANSGLLYAIGGIETADRARTAIQHGADGVAGIRAFRGEAIIPLVAALSGPLLP